MSTNASVTPALEPEVSEFARERQVEQYLQPIWEMTNEHFPTAKSIRFSLYKDPEISSLQHILVTVQIEKDAFPNFVDAHKKWTFALFDLCPAPLIQNFGLYPEMF